jgi:homoserine kinase type II
MKIEKILKNWDIGKIKKIKLSEEGVVNYNWFVETDKGKYFLRKFVMNRKISDLKFEIDYLKKLQVSGFKYPTPNPIATIKNKFLVGINKKYFWLDNFIEGKIRREFKKKELGEVAKMISEYHNILEKLKLKSGGKDIDDLGRKGVLNEMEGFIRKLSKLKKLSKEEKNYLNETEKLIPILNGVNVRKYSRLKKYAIHRDLHQDNILWHRGKISGVLDFENVAFGNDTFVKDICIILQYSCSDNELRLNFANARFFLREYKKYRKLKEKELQLIPDIIAAGFIEDFEYQYWLFVNDKKRMKKPKFKRYSEAAQWYWNNKSKILREIK